MDNLPADIISMCGKQRRSQKLVGAVGNVGLGLQILFCKLFSITGAPRGCSSHERTFVVGCEAQIGSQGIVDKGV
jgi:hypothetical protein